MGKIVILGDVHTLLPYKLAGMEAIEANNWEEAVEKIKTDLSRRNDISIVFLAAHLIPDDKRGEFRSLASETDFTLMSLPTKWAPPKPVDMKKMLLEALGFG